MVDYQTIFCDGQVIEGTTLSDRAIDLQTLADYGKGKPWSVHVIAQGAHEHDLRVQIVGSKTATFNDVVVVGDSGVIPRAKLVQGFDRYIDVNAVGEKYRYLALRFIPTIDGNASETISAGTKGTDAIPSVLRVGEVPAPIANGIRAQIELLNNTNVAYRHANDDKSYSASQNV